MTTGAPAIYRTRITHRPARTRAPPVRVPRIQLVRRHRRTATAAAMAAAVRPVRRPRPLHRSVPTTRCATGSTRSWPSTASICRGGRITALLQARVLGYVFNPLSLFWCHDADGVLRHVIAEVHNTYGGRHAYLLPPDRRSPRRRREEALRLAVQRGRRPLPGAGAATRRTTRRDDHAAPGATSRRSSRRCAATGGDGRLRLVTTADGGPGGTVDGGAADSRPGHHTVATPGARWPAERVDHL